jgi:hypothetical protein
MPVLTVGKESPRISEARLVTSQKTPDARFGGEVGEPEDFRG